MDDCRQPIKAVSICLESDLMMKVMEIIDLSTTDWPGKAAMVVFFEGCPLSCPRCHNKKFSGVSKYTSVQQLFDMIYENFYFLEAVVFSGGEALLYSKDLLKVCKKTQELGLLTALETSGVLPENLKSLLAANAIDKVFLDVKGSLVDKGLLQKRTGNTKMNVAIDIGRSITYILMSNASLELRVTVFPDYPTEQEITKIFSDVGNMFKISNKSLEFRLLRGVPIYEDFYPLSLKDLSILAESIEGRLPFKADIKVGTA